MSSNESTSSLSSTEGFVFDDHPPGHPVSRVDMRFIMGNAGVKRKYGGDEQAVWYR